MLLAIASSIFPQAAAAASSLALIFQQAPKVPALEWFSPQVCVSPLAG